MTDLAWLRSRLVELDRAPYPAYRTIKGVWDLGVGRLEVVWVQGDPYAAPSVVAVHLPGSAVELPPEVLSTRARRTGVEAFFARAFARAPCDERIEGSGRSGAVVLQDPGQLVLPQSAVRLTDEGGLVARFRVGLPARGRRILGRAAADLLTGHLPARVAATLRAGAHDPGALAEAARVNEDAEALRAGLAEAGLVAFVADGARLPRRSGIDDRPLDRALAVPFESPPSLRVGLETPHAGVVTGMGVPTGVTVIAGGGFHGKSTLLRAIERGVYNHAPGDGREFVVTDRDAVKIRAEDGRAVTGVDLSPFIDGLPGDRDTSAFATGNASGSTSQAAALVEALESGARALLMDEDTTATNLMIRDRRMQALVPDRFEPITPYVDRARALSRESSVSTVLVVGGSGDYLEVADTVVVMRDYRPLDATGSAREVVEAHPTGRPVPAGALRLTPARRVPTPAGLSPRRGRRPVSVKVRNRRLSYGCEEIDLSAVDQLVHPGQMRAVGAALVRLHRWADEAPAPLAELLDRLDALLSDGGPDVLDDFGAGETMAVRRHEVAAALNRLRSLTLRDP